MALLPHSPIRTMLSDLSFFLCVYVCVFVLGLPSTYSISFGNDTRYFTCTRSVWPLLLFSLSPLAPPFAFCSFPPSLRLLFSSFSLGSILFSSDLCLQSDPSPWFCLMWDFFNVFYTPSESVALPLLPMRGQSQPRPSPCCIWPRWLSLEEPLSRLDAASGICQSICVKTVSEPQLPEDAQAIAGAAAALGGSGEWVSHNCKAGPGGSSGEGQRVR